MQEYAAGHAEGRQAGAGELAALLERAEQEPERLWGTRWTSPWWQTPPAALSYRPSGWIFGLAIGMDASALIAANEPLGAPDRAALRTLMNRHFLRYAVPNIRAKLLWDALEPGGRMMDVDRAVLNALVLAKGRVWNVATRAYEIRPQWDNYQRRVERLCPGPG